jgi:hypothetical protein
MMKNKTKIFYDFEATSVSRDADPISLGIVAVQNNKIVSTWYSEFTDFNPDKADQWVKDNIIASLQFTSKEKIEKSFNSPTLTCSGNSNHISKWLKEWLSQFKEVEFWADFDVIDKPMLIDLIADWNKQDSSFVVDTELSDPPTDIYYQFKVGLPKHLPNIKYYDFYDIHTLIKNKGIDPDIERSEFALDTKEDYMEYMEECNMLGLTKDNYNLKHFALYDAYINWKFYEKLNK